MKKYLLSLITLLTFVSQTTFAQQIGAWQMYLSYQNATKNVVAGDVIYSLTDGNLFSYNTNDTEVRCYNTLNLLNDVKITHIGYSKEAKRLIVVYDNCNIDLIDANDNVINLAALKDKSITDKEISRIYIYGTTAFLVTGFGFVEVDMKEGVFRNTYRLELEIQSIAVSSEQIFLCTLSGIYACDRTANMQQKTNWTKIASGNCVDMVWFDNNLVVRRDRYYISYINPKNGSEKRICDGTFTFMKLENDQLVWVNSSNIYYTNTVTTYTTIKHDNQWSDVSYHNGIFWASENYQGLRAYKQENNAMVATGTVVQPNSPIRDCAYSLTWIGNRLLVAGGINTVGTVKNAATAMYYENGEWTNFQELDLTSKYSNISYINTTNLVQDPQDPTHHFASLYRTGLVEYRDGKAIQLYNCENSPLKSILEYNPRYYNFVSCAGAQYDPDGNLWMLNSMTDTVVRVLKNDGKWAGLYYEEIKSASLCDNYLFHSSGRIFLTSRRMDQRGVFCFDTNGTINSTRDDKHLLRTQIINEDETTYEPLEYYCLCEDLQGCIWVGTSEGLFVIENPDDFFNENFRYLQVKINREDGSGLADYLLNGVTITCITVDAANRKWIGTETNGVYLISGDGQELIHHFTTSDSPILSDKIYSIAINHETGEAVFGTENGLCSYLADATTPAESLDKNNVTVYPNPVRSDYRGPIIIRGLVMNSEVKILSSAGQLVWTGSSNGGSCSWNGCNRNGARVSSGVYHVVANDEKGDKAIVTRIVVIK